MTDEASRSRLALLVLVTAGLAACSTAPAPVPPASPKPVAAAIGTRPMVQPGCLLPEKSLFMQAPEANEVSLQVMVLPDGSAAHASIARSTGYEPLDQAFIEAALKCRYSPARLDDGTRVARTHLMTQNWRPGQSFTGPQRCFLPDYPTLALRTERSGEVRLRFMLPEAQEAAQVLVMPPTEPVFATPAKAMATGCLALPEARLGLKLQQWYEVSFYFRID